MSYCSSVFEGFTSSAHNRNATGLHLEEKSPVNERLSKSSEYLMLQQVPEKQQLQKYLRKNKHTQHTDIQGSLHSKTTW